MSRRSVLAGGAFLGVAAAAGGTVATGRADDVLDALGVDPKALPDAGDEAIAATARAELDALIGLAREQGAPDVVVAALTGQADAFAPSTRTATVTGDLAEACRAQADARADDVLRAVSPELAVVLAAVAAGLDQCADEVAA